MVLRILAEIDLKLSNASLYTRIIFPEIRIDDLHLENRDLANDTHVAVMVLLLINRT